MIYLQQKSELSSRSNVNKTRRGIHDPDLIEELNNNEENVGGDSPSNEMKWVRKSTMATLDNKYAQKNRRNNNNDKTMMNMSNTAFIE